MKFSLRGCLLLKPFDETDDACVAGGWYAGSIIVSCAVVVSAILSIVSLVFVITSHSAAMQLLAIAIGVSAFTAGLEWNAGLKARSLNQLFSAVILTVCVLLFGNI